MGNGVGRTLGGGGVGLDGCGMGIEWTGWGKVRRRVGKISNLLQSGVDVCLRGGVGLGGAGWSGVGWRRVEQGWGGA